MDHAAVERLEEVLIASWSAKANAAAQHLYRCLGYAPAYSYQYLQSPG